LRVFATGTWRLHQLEYPTDRGRTGFRTRI
jgi:hypothetical protein